MIRCARKTSLEKQCNAIKKNFLLQKKIRKYEQQDSNCGGLKKSKTQLKLGKPQLIKTPDCMCSPSAESSFQLILSVISKCPACFDFTLLDEI